MIPVNQICPGCKQEFLGSDMIGFPCPSCQGWDITALNEALHSMNQMHYKEDDTDDRPKPD